MPSLLDLPLELKLEILNQIDSMSDLEAIRSSCYDFYRTSKAQLWKHVQNTVFENETRKSVTKELVALFRIRSLKSRYSCEELLEMHSLRDTKVDEHPDIQELMQLRRTIHWFTHRFFDYHLEDLPEESKPSRNEISRVNNAFCLLWLWAEAAYKPCGRLPECIAEVVNWALQNTNSAAVGSMAGMLYIVYEFVKSELAAIGQSWLQYATVDYKRTHSRHGPCLSQYTTIGMPNLALTDLGLDGIKNLLESTLDQQLAHANAYISCKCQSNIDEAFDRYDLVDLFALLLYQQWAKEPRDLRLATKPVWSTTGCLYSVQSPPWAQDEGLQLEKIFWDDERLWRWGYQPPLEISRRYTGYSLNHARPDPSDCVDCSPEWGCTYRREIWSSTKTTTNK